MQRIPSPCDSASTDKEAPTATQSSEKEERATGSDKAVDVAKMSWPTRVAPTSSANKRRRGGACTVIYAGRPEESEVGGDAEDPRGPCVAHGEKEAESQRVAA